MKKQTPDIYKGVISNPKNNNRCLIEDNQHGFFLFETKSQNHLCENGIFKKWNGAGEFLELPEQTLLTYHSEVFGQEPPKNTPRTTYGLYTWHVLCNTAKDRTEDTKTPTLESGRKSTILTSKYEHGELRKGNGTIITPQAKECILLFREAMSNQTSITEEDLRNYIEANKERLQTRQPSWRIFQYYRAKLIENKILKRS